jgi:putative OPT family oligopeptide transporter
LVGPEQKLAEITIKGLLLGAVLSMALAAANAYIGLLVGLTVSASIPAAAVSMGVLRLFKRSNILENNLVQTAASAGESLVAGIIFTIPALVMMEVWPHYQYWPLVYIAVLGGVLGVAFTIPLRRALIVEAKLAYPEGVATAEVLRTGGIEQAPHLDTRDAGADRGFRMLIQAALIGTVFKLLESAVGIIAGGAAKTAALLKGSYLFRIDVNFSPALLGVGYIVGLNIATLVFMGGVIGTIIGVPLNWAFNGDSVMQAAGIDPATPFVQLTTDQWVAISGEAWQNCRRIGVGAMIVGGVWSLVALAKPLLNGVRASLQAYRDARGGEGGTTPRTELDTPINIVALVVLIAVIPLYALFHHVLAGYPDQILIASIMTVLMLVFGFLFSSVAGYMAGLVGSSNNPISGVTIATVIVSALILLQLMGNEGMAATLGPIAVLYLAGLICSSAAIAGDNMQDLKCGHIVGATPWRQQIYQVVGVASAALVIPFILQVLDKGRGIGRQVQEGIEPLAAPQAGLMRDLATGIFGAGIDWIFIYIGFALAVLLILLDKFQENRGSSFRFPVLAVAVGVYLPLGLSIPIFAGGLLVHFANKKSTTAPEQVRQNRANNGLLLASGLITGEALMGVVVAIAVAFFGLNPGTYGIAVPLAIISMVAIAIYLFRRPLTDD